MLEVADADAVARNICFLFGFCTRNQDVEMITWTPLQINGKMSQLLPMNAVKVEEKRALELLPSSSDGKCARHVLAFLVAEEYGTLFDLNVDCRVLKIKGQSNGIKMCNEMGQKWKKTNEIHPLLLTQANRFSRADSL